MSDVVEMIPKQFQPVTKEIVEKSTWRAIMFGDGAGGSYTQMWSSPDLPEVTWVISQPARVKGHYPRMERTFVVQIDDDDIKVDQTGRLFKEVSQELADAINKVRAAAWAIRRETGFVIQEEEKPNAL